MFTVELRNFRCHSDKRVDFKYNGSTRLEGPNGCGKSTIYKAVDFALFPKKGMKVQKKHATSPAIVTLTIPRVGTITRTSAQNALTVTRRGVSITGDEAEEFVSRVFGHKNLWNVCTHFNNCVHPFLDAPASRKIEMINWLVGNNDAIKEKISARLSDARVEMNKAQAAYHTKKIQHVALHGSDFASVGKAILEPSDLKEVEYYIEASAKDVAVQEDELQRLALLQSRESVLESKVSTSNYTEEGLNALTEMKKAYDVYAEAESKYRQASNSPRGTPRLVAKHYTEKEIQKATTLAKVYTDTLAICETLDIPYNEEEARELSTKCSRQIVETERITEEHRMLVIHYETQAAIRAKDASEREEKIARINKQLNARERIILSEYEKTMIDVAKVRELKRQRTALQVDLDDLNVGDDACDTLVVLEKDLEDLELRASYTSLFETHARLNLLKVNLEKCGQQHDIEYLTRSIQSRSTIEARSAYETEYSTMFPLPVDQSVVTNKVYKLKQQLRDINLSKEVKHCPHCSGSLVIRGQSIDTYDGVVVTGDTREISETIRNLEALARMKYPDAPVHPINTTTPIKELQIMLAKAKEAQALRVQIENHPKLDELPEDIDYISSKDTTTEIASIKRSMTACEKSLLISAKIDILDERIAAFPESVPNKPVLTDDEEYSRLVQEKRSLTPINQPPLERAPHLDSLLAPFKVHSNPSGVVNAVKDMVFVEPPEMSPDYMRRCETLAQAKDRLDKLDKCDRVTTDEVVAYATNLGAYTSALKELSEVREKMSGIHYTQRELSVTKRRLDRARRAVTNHYKDVVVRDSYNALKRVKSVFISAKKKYDNIFEFKEVVEAKQKARSVDFIKGLERDINLFIRKVGVDVYINIVYTDKISIVCYSKNEEVGKPKELSDGEHSLMSFAMTVAFALQSPSPVLILDEVTDKLSRENKSRAIEVLLETLGTSKKCLIITDHNCCCGDFDDIITL